MVKMQGIFVKLQDGGGKMQDSAGFHSQALISDRQIQSMYGHHFLDRDGDKCYNVFIICKKTALQGYSSDEDGIEQPAEPQYQKIRVVDKLMLS